MGKRERLIYGIIASIIAAVMLFIATNDMEYGYYNFLRFAVTVAGILTAIVAYKFKSYIISTLSVLVSLFFNPFIPVTLERSTWNTIGYIVALYFVIVAIVFIIEARQINKKQVHTNS